MVGGLRRAHRTKRGTMQITHNTASNTLSMLVVCDDRAVLCKLHTTCKSIEYSFNNTQCWRFCDAHRTTRGVMQNYIQHTSESSFHNVVVCRRRRRRRQMPWLITRTSNKIANTREYTPNKIANTRDTFNVATREHPTRLLILETRQKYIYNTRRHGSTATRDSTRWASLNANQTLPFNVVTRLRLKYIYNTRGRGPTTTRDSTHWICCCIPMWTLATTNRR